MNSHLAFSIRRSQLADRTLIPKFYDPDISASISDAQSDYEVPELRELLLLGDEGSRLGHWIRREEYGGGDVPFVRTSDLSHWRIRLDFKKGVSIDVYKRLKDQQDVRPCDLLMVAHGTYLVGTVAMVMAEDVPMVLQDHVFRLRVDPASGVDPYVLLAALSTGFVRRQVRARQFSADIIDKIGNRHLGLRVAIPKSKDGNEEIRARVKAVLDQQTETRRRIQEASQSDLRMSRERADARLGFPVRRLALTNRILIPKYYDPVVGADLQLAEQNAGEPWVTLGQLADERLISCENGVEVGKMAYGTGNIPFIRTSDLTGWEVKLDVRQGVSQDVYDQHWVRGSVQEDDVLVVRDGTYLVGSSALITSAEVPALICGGIVRIRTLDPEIVSPYALLAFLNLPLVRRQMRTKQFTRDVIDTLGARLLEIKVPDPRSEQAQSLASSVRSIMLSKLGVKYEIGKIVSICAPHVTRATDRPGWSMR